MSIEELTTSARIGTLTAVSQMAATALRDYTDDPAGDQALEEAIKNILFRIGGSEKHSHYETYGQKITMVHAGDHTVMTSCHKYIGEPKDGWLIEGTLDRAADEQNAFKIVVRRNGVTQLKGRVIGGRVRAREVLLGAIKGLIGYQHFANSHHKESK